MSVADPVTDVREISHIAYGFIASKALFVALDLNLFGAIEEGAGTVDALARATGATPNATATLLAALEGCGLVVRKGDGYRNAPATARYLVPGARAYFGDYYRYQIDRILYPAQVHLTAGVRGEGDQVATGGLGGILTDPDEADAFTRAQHAGSLGPAILFAQAIDLSDAGTLLDVGGGSGAFSIVLCRKYPDLASTIIEFPSVAAAGRVHVEEAGLSDRIAYLEGNALAVDWPGGQDVVLMSYLLSALAGDDLAPTVAKAYDALAPGGRLIVHDFMLDDEGGGPAQAALWFLQYLAYGTDCVSFAYEDIAALAAGAGLTVAERGPLIPEITGCVIATKPAGPTR